MRFTVPAVLVCSCMFALQAQTINILGYVKTFDNKPIPGVTVTLVKKAQVTTTDAAGMFAFPSSTAVRADARAAGQSLAVKHDIVALYLRENGRVALDMFDVRGALFHTFCQGDLAAGRHHFNLPTWRIIQQVYLLRLKIGSSFATYKLMLTDQGFCLSDIAIRSSGPVREPAARAALPLPQRSAVVDTIRMSHPDYNAEYFTFSKYADTFNLVLAKKDWQKRFPMTCRVIYDDSTLHGYQEFGRWKPGVAGKNAWLDSVGRVCLGILYKDSLECLAPIRGKKVSDTFIYHVARAQEAASLGKAVQPHVLSRMQLDFPGDQWLYEDLTGTWCCFSACTAKTQAGKIACGRQELRGVICHELFGHGLSNEDGYFGNPPNAKFFEGKNDCARYWEGGFWRHAAAKPSEAIVDSAAYQSLGFFLVWLEEEKYPQLIYKLNQYCAKGKTWTWATDWAAFIKDADLKDYKSLWTEYKATFY